MARRIKIEMQTLSTEGRRLNVVGYRPTPASRFAVTRAADRPEGPWLITHVRSGCGVTSILPATSRKLTMTDKLAVIAAWEAMTHLDWSAFDELPQVTPDSNKFPLIDQTKAPPAVRAMRETAATILNA